MRQFFANAALRAFVLRTALPILGAAVLGAGIVAAVLVWSGSSSDEVAVERQEQLAELVISRLQTSLARDQDSTAIWDDAVREVKSPTGAEWVDANLGSWMLGYFNLDIIFILDSENRPIYAFADGAPASLDTFEEARASVEPVAARLRAELREGTGRARPDGTSPGFSDLAMVGEHPSLLSIKAIVPDTEAVSQVPGSEYLHVAVRRLDGSLQAELQNDYLFDGARFSRADETATGETSLPLHADSGAPLGFMVWRPYLPGTAVVRSLAPVLALLVLGMVGALSILIVRLWRRSVRLQASEAAVHHLALHDALTGLPNRTRFNAKLEERLAAPDARTRPRAVLFLDMDRFKQVNDTLGHPTGDELIRRFGARLSALLRPNDLVARIGGDEFNIMVGGGSDVKGVEALCERIVAAIAQPFDIDGNHIGVGVSIGVALVPEHGTERTELTRKADIALYHAKSAGRGRFAVFGKDMDAQVQERRGIEDDLRRALARGSSEIEIFYQPLHSTEDGHITGVEALARWNHPTRGTMQPALFIPVAEETGLIERLGQVVLERACRAVAGWPVEKVTVNASAVELRNPRYAGRVAETLEASGLDPGRLEIDVAESALADKGGVGASNIRILRQMGVRVALDDFGTGFSSLNRLGHLDVDRVKIDGSFIQGLGRSPSDEAIVRAIVALAKATGLKSTAEGVETPEQGSELKRIGCDDVQGYFLSKPMPESVMDALLRGGNPARVN